MDDTLSLQKGIPLYRQLSKLIEDQIAIGRWKQGEKIASEAELCRLFGVSRITVRAALEELVDEGMLVKVQGRGTYVNNPKSKKMLSIGTTSFAEMCASNHMIAKRVQLEKKIIDARENDIAKLELTPGDKVISLVRVLYADEIPLIIATDHICNDFSYLMDVDLESGSLNEFMLNRGIIQSLTARERMIEICAATAKEAMHLNLLPGSPVLLLRDLAIDQNGRPVRWTKEIIAADKVRIEYTNLDKTGR